MFYRHVCNTHTGTPFTSCTSRESKRHQIHGTLTLSPISRVDKFLIALAITEIYIYLSSVLIPVCCSLLEILLYIDTDSYVNYHYKCHVNLQKYTLEMNRAIFRLTKQFFVEAT